VTKYKRKIIIFIVALVVAIGASLFMAIEYYKEFLYFLMVISSGFFMGNGLEHISKSIRRKGDDRD